MIIHQTFSVSGSAFSRRNKTTMAYGVQHKTNTATAVTRVFIRLI